MEINELSLVCCCRIVIDLMVVSHGILLSVILNLIGWSKSVVSTCALYYPTLHIVIPGMSFCIKAIQAEFLTFQ